MLSKLNHSNKLTETNLLTKTLIKKETSKQSNANHTHPSSINQVTMLQKIIEHFRKTKSQAKPLDRPTVSYVCFVLCNLTMVKSY